MKQILGALAEAIREQTLALQTVADQVAALKQTLAKRDSGLAEELKQQIETAATQAITERVTTLQQTLMTHDSGLADELRSQIEEDHEKSRTALYELQVSLAKVREAIEHLPDATDARAKKSSTRALKQSKGRRGV